MNLLIRYPALTAEYDTDMYEFVGARDIEATGPQGRHLYELTSHAICMPLAPGDVVVVEDGEVVGIDTLAETFTLDVDFQLPDTLQYGHIPPEQPVGWVPDRTDRVTDLMTTIVERWTRAAYVTQHTGVSFMVSAPWYTWLHTEVGLCDLVLNIGLVRHPGMKIAWQVAIANAGLGDLLTGPWA